MMSDGSLRGPSGVSGKGNDESRDFDYRGSDDMFFNQSCDNNFVLDGGSTDINGGIRDLMAREFR